MAKDSKAFEIFKKEFKRYQEFFGLLGYEVRFEFKPLNNAIAKINIEQEEMVAYVEANSKSPTFAKDSSEAIKTAKHEAIHLLIGRLRDYAYCRFLTPENIYEAGEELVRKLERLIPDLPDGK